MREKTLIRAENLCAGYDANGDILHDISFTLRDGEKLCVIGPNGCGKTTLLRVLAGTLPYRGSLAVTIQDSASPRYGREIERTALAAKEAARESGFLTQLTTAYFSFTVAETVMLGRYAHQNSGFAPGTTKMDRRIAEKAMKACGIQDIRKETLACLSGGQLQRVFLARTLAQNPAVMLLDEPTNHLDLFYQLELLRQLDTWIEDGTHAAVGVFHDLSLALRFADTILLLDQGRVADYGEAKKVVSGEAINRVYRIDVQESLRELLQNW